MTMETYRLDEDLYGYQSPHISRMQHHHIMMVFSSIRANNHRLRSPEFKLLETDAEREQATQSIQLRHDKLIEELQTIYPNKDICNRFGYSTYLKFERKYGISPKTKLEGLEFLHYNQIIVLRGFHYKIGEVLTNPFVVESNTYDIQWERWFHRQHNEATPFLVAYAKPIDTLFYNSRG